MAAIVNAATTQLNRALFALAAGSGARAGELFALRVESDMNLNERTNGTPLYLSNVLEHKLQLILRKLKLAQPGTGMHAFRSGRISHLVYSGVSRQVIRDWCGHSSDRMIDHYTKMLRQHHAPEMAKVKPLLGRSWTPTGREESGTLVQPAVK